MFNDESDSDETEIPKREKRKSDLYAQAEAEAVGWSDTLEQPWEFGWRDGPGESYIFYWEIPVILTTRPPSGKQLELPVYHYNQVDGTTKHEYLSDKYEHASGFNKVGIRQGTLQHLATLMSIWLSSEAEWQAPHGAKYTLDLSGYREHRINSNLPDRSQDLIACISHAIEDERMTTWQMYLFREAVEEEGEEVGVGADGFDFYLLDEDGEESEEDDD